MKATGFLLSLMTVFWTSRSNADALDVWFDRGVIASGRISAFAVGDGCIVGVGSKSNIVTSVDGAHWIVRGVDPGNCCLGLRSLAFWGLTYGNGQFIAAGLGYYESLPVWSSHDGIKWSKHTLGSNGPYQGSGTSGVAFGKGVFVAVGGHSLAPSIIFTSEDGDNWTRRTIADPSPLPAGLLSVAYGNGRFVALGYDVRDHSPVVFVSADGTNWTWSTTTVGGGLCFGNGLFVAAGGSGSIWTSANGTDWQNQVSGTTNSFQAVAYGNGTYVAVGEAGTIITSRDGIAWQVRNSGTTSPLTAVAAAKDTFVVGTASGNILQSANLGGPHIVSFTQSDRSGGQLRIETEPVAALLIQTSTDLRHWADLTTLSNTSTSFEFTDTYSSTFSTRFYRLVTP